MQKVTSVNRKVLILAIVVAAVCLVVAAYVVGRRTAPRPVGGPANRTTLPTSTMASPPIGVLQTTLAPAITTANSVVPNSVLAGCSGIGGTPVEGQDNWYILGPTYLNPECKNVPYIGPDGVTYYDNFPLTRSGISTTDVYGYTTASALNGTAATESECTSGQYPQANPGVNTPGKWDSQLGLCLT